MSWFTMSAELADQCPVPFLFARTLVNRAWLNVQRKHLWSFLWGKRPIATPIPTLAGTVTITSGSPTITGDATATTAWNAIPGATPITTQQFRVGQGTIYNIIAYQVVGGFGVLTLDTPYVDPLPGGVGMVVGSAYQIYGVYYNAPVSDFLWWESITDPVSGYAMKCTMTTEFVDSRDPQRFQGGWPVGPIPYLVNPNPGTFFGYPMYEMWPAPLNNYTFVGSYFRRGTMFVNDSDNVNPMLGEDVVIAQAKMLAYEWCSANPNKVPKGPYNLLYGQAKNQYDGFLNDYILADESFSHRHVIDYPGDQFLSELPWVSNKQELIYAP